MNSEVCAEDITLAIGVSGHRWATESLDLLNSIDEVLERIAQSYSYKELTLISPLAEGADRIVAMRVLSLPGTRLFALLPFPIKEYLKDFSSKESEQEFQALFHQAEQVKELPGGPDREEAYVALGRVLLDQSDLLIAVWDGKPSNGRGGTEEVVQMARERGLPLAWILYDPPDLNEGDTIPHGETKRKVIYERFPG